MGGGKSHALVGLYHLASASSAFLETDLGHLVKAEAEQAGGNLDLSGARVVVLSADNMTPGAASPEFGPATSLYERFLWSLFKGDKSRYNQHLAEGPNKAALARALEAVGGPVLILLDELMDYVMPLSDKQHLASMPGEKAFLNSLMDAVDDVDQVAFVVVMIRSDLDERGYTVEAEDFRAYIATRLERNGVTVAVTEAQDFSAIIRRRLFERAGIPRAAAGRGMARRCRRGLAGAGIQPPRSQPQPCGLRRPPCGQLPVLTRPDGPGQGRLVPPCGLPAGPLHGRDLRGNRLLLDARARRGPVGSGTRRRREPAAPGCRRADPLVRPPARQRARDPGLPPGRRH